MKKLFSAILTVLLVLGPGSPGFSGDAVDIARLVQEAPPLDTYGDVPGAVWQRREAYRLRPDGAMEKDSLWVVMITEKIDSAWPERHLSVPPGGELEIHEADLYDPVSGSRIRSVPWSIKDDRGYKKCVMDMGEPEEAVLVLRFRQVYPMKMSVEGLIRPSCGLPLWEGVFSVSFPSGSELFVQSDKMGRPKIDRAGGESVYSWTVYNVPGAKRQPLIQGEEPYLAFSLRSGKVPFVQILSRLEKSPIPPMPDEFARLTQMGDKTKAGKKLMKALDGRAIWNSPGVLRDPIPSSGPWTETERALVLNGWLKDLGWSSRVVWITFLPIGASEPAFADNLLLPVLMAAPPGSKPWFFLPGQTVEPGETPPALVGKTLYGGSVEEGLLSFSMNKGKAEDHRLTLSWDLNLEEQGVLAGTLRLWVRNGWAGLLPGPDSLSWQTLEDAIPGISSWKNGRPSVSPMDYGFRIDLPVKKSMGIPGGPGMLLRFPCLLPGALGDLARSEPPRELLFPFVLEQKYSIRLPDGFSPMSLPGMSDRTDGDLRFSETLRYSKKQRSLEGEEKIIAGSSLYDDGFSVGLNRMIGAWIRWGDLSVPLLTEK